MTLDAVRGALLAGGLGQRMGTLTEGTCKPLVPYAASCRLVDFSLANAVRSGVPEVVLLSLHREADLVRHLMEHWDAAPGTRLHFGVHERRLRNGGLPAPGERLPPRPAERGTADALLANARHLFAPGARDILIQHADHVYVHDYAAMLEQHRRTGADCTIGVQAVEPRWVRLFGMVETDADLRVRALVEKPDHPTSDLVFTAFCLFRADVLRDTLARLAALGPDGWQHDISRDVLPAMIGAGRDVRAFPVESYWADIGTVERYHSEQLALLTVPRPIPAEALPRTLAAGPPRFAPDGAGLLGAEPAPGALVRDSVLHPGCHVRPGAAVVRSVVLPGAVVPTGVTVRDTVVRAGEHLSADRTGLTALGPAPRA
ncbi:sugar phosphate nucleotidyltransferase [Streptomyces sp. SL13]|uniref:Sugar phosphate nucleotidyltransferase n=1 Tax=Streptantibioticus silvisoli TaxID=2705255 RepID=A0AA90KHY8_9ACTN|nr:sugar phosphate nucleotidyltransferase [Streptantibioticus silvisoli]MDI5972450.1 sugar phosphate nucleotidyltransferase [Streptantibioticus silvisoli]